MSPKKRDFNFDEEQKIVGMFTDNAKMYIQLSGAALGLSITFVRQIQGVAEGKPLPFNRLVIASWVAFLLTIGVGAFYQYVAVSYLGLRKATEEMKGYVSRSDWLVREMFVLQRVMLASFYMGAVLFTAGAISKL